MQRRVPWRDPAVLRLMQNFSTDEIDTGEKLARSISEMTGVSVTGSSVNRQLQKILDLHVRLPVFLVIHQFV